jgi:hypothetical protein
VSSAGISGTFRLLNANTLLSPPERKSLAWNELSNAYYAEELRTEFKLILLESKSYWCSEHLFIQPNKANTVYEVVGFDKISKVHLFDELAKHRIPITEISRITEVSRLVSG